MKKQALILLFPLAIFFTETASFLPCWDATFAIDSKEKKTCTAPLEKKCSSTKEQGTCNSVKPATACSAKPEKKSCTKAKNTCEKKKGCEKKPSGKDCADDPDCSTCPVCYNFIFQPRFEWTEEAFAVKRTYSLLSTDYNFSYEVSVWKPPNGYPFSPDFN